MNFITQHITQIIEKFDGTTPLAIFLKDYFKKDNKIGSRDRKAISEGVYIYYRSALFLDAEQDVLDTIRQGYVLCKSQNSYLKYKLDLPEVLDEKVDAYAPEVGVPLSEGVDMDEWLKSHWYQPDLFIRIVQNEELVLDLLQKNNIAYTVEKLTPAYTCLRLPNSAPIDKLLLPEDYVIQDRSSQLALINAKKTWQAKQPKFFWDVCAGAGGKTLQLQQLYKNELKIIASDVRASILHNLRSRCLNYGIKGVSTSILDATSPEAIAKGLGKKNFDVVLCDVPCTGSGTWTRTPEQLFFFDAEYFDRFEHLQYPIVLNASKYVSHKGYLVYITCSVFKHENEAVVDKLVKNTAFELVHSEMILGMQEQSDTLYIAILKRKSTTPQES